MGVKGLSKIQVNKAIHQMIQQALKMFKNMQKTLVEKDKEFTNPATFIGKDALHRLKEIVEKDKKNYTRNQQRKKEGHLFEANVFEKLSNDLKEIIVGDIEYEVNWEVCNDAIISAKNDMEGQAIDSLAKIEFETYSVWLPIQCKDRESALPDAELTKFRKSIQEFREKS
jgi:hypothetical protein